MPINIADWITTNIFCSTAKKIDILRDRILPLLQDLQQSREIEYYFFMHYKGGRHHLKVVICKNSLSINQLKNRITSFCNENADIIIDNNFSVPGNDPQRDYIDGDFGLLLSCYSREMRDLIINKIGKKPTREQMSYVLHYLANPLGFGYIDEIHYYSMLMANPNYLAVLPEDLKNRLIVVLREVLSFTATH